MCNNVYYDCKSDRFYHDKKRREGSTITPITLCYHIGYNCNLKCDYCLSKNVITQQVKTDLDDYIEYIKGWNPLRLVISGGEPLLYMDKLVRILEKLKNQGIYTFLSTNGILIKKEYFRLQGLVDWYDISLPAIDKETYMYVRGEDKFDDIIESIKLLKNNGERVRLTFTVNEKNKEDILDFPEFAIRHGIDNIRIGHTFSNVDGKLVDELWKEEYVKEIDFYRDRLKIYLPLSEAQLLLYNQGYIVIENDGSIYRNFVNDENYVCHVSEIEQYADIFSKIAKLQIKLFAEDYNGNNA